jgi:hypothetical protein
MVDDDDPSRCGMIDTGVEVTIKKCWMRAGFSFRMGCIAKDYGSYEERAMGKRGGGRVNVKAMNGYNDVNI